MARLLIISGQATGRFCERPPLTSLLVYPLSSNKRLIPNFKVAAAYFSRFAFIKINPLALKPISFPNVTLHHQPEMKFHRLCFKSVLS
jgi:hypothetical protein